jgi:hypothetical protein
MTLLRGHTPGDCIALFMLWSNCLAQQKIAGSNRVLKRKKQTLRDGRSMSAWTGRLRRTVTIPKSPNSNTSAAGVSYLNKLQAQSNRNPTVWTGRLRNGASATMSFSVQTSKRSYLRNVTAAQRPVKPKVKYPSVVSDGRSKRFQPIGLYATAVAPEERFVPLHRLQVFKKR